MLALYPGPATRDLLTNLFKDDDSLVDSPSWASNPGSCFRTQHLTCATIADATLISACYKNYAHAFCMSELKNFFRFAKSPSFYPSEAFPQTYCGGMMYVFPSVHIVH